MPLGLEDLNKYNTRGLTSIGLSIICVGEWIDNHNAVIDQYHWNAAIYDAQHEVLPYDV